MSKILNQPKVAHPNRLVNKHEEFIINKSLANKVRHVKSSIPVENQTFERILNTRQKRETQRSSHNKVRLPDSQGDLEGDHNEYYENNRGETDLLNYYSKAAETLPGRPAGSSSRSGQENSLMMAKSGPIQFASSPRSVIERGAYVKFPANGTAASYRVDSRGTSPDRADYIAEKLAEKNREMELLKSKLEEKSHEIESLKSELRGKRSGDVSVGGSPSKENQVQNGQTRYGGSGHPTTLLNRDVSGKSLKPINMGKSSAVGIERQNSDVKMKKQLSLGSEKKMADMMQHQAHYEESLRILERFEEIERSKKKLEPIKKELKEVKVERPASVKNKTKPNNEKFKIRFSNHLEQGSLKANTRYKSDGVEVIDEMMEQEREETQSDIVEEKLEIKEPKVILAAAANKRKNNRYQQPEEDDFMEAESPQIVMTSKTLMLSRNNGVGLRNHGLTDSEVLIE